MSKRLDYVQIAPAGVKALGGIPVACKVQPIAGAVIANRTL